MNTLVEMLSPGFLLREALMGSVLVGCLCPLVECTLSSDACFSWGWPCPSSQRHRPGLPAVSHARWSAPALYASERWLALLGSLSCTLVGLLVLAALARHRETVEARIASPMRLPPLLRSCSWPWIRRRRHTW